MLNKLKFDLTFSYLGDLNINKFIKHIILLYDNMFYKFELGVTYHFHGFDPTGKVF